MAESSQASSSSSPSSSHPDFSSLPIMSMKEKIVGKILENRVTLIVGETGCGKSSQVPQFLLQENMDPILCTQPRRFAVVAIAKMVAKARNCELGGEVGYHIGHMKVLSTRSKIVFKTAGVLLEEMREKGLNALKYKAIILDEVHERSVESDLVLVCVKQFLLKNNNLRVVLMSATADVGRYKDYFKDLGRGERVEVLAIPSSCQQAVFQRKVSYLEQVTEYLGISSESLASTYCSGPSPSMAAADVKPEVNKLIHDLLLHIHENEPDMEKSILVFLPTYHDLEKQWYLLKPLSSAFKVHILHRSIDIEQALMAMKISKSHRKVILATNIAESSVTIPKVAYVIDSCRSLQVFWDAARKRDSVELVWVSKSQAEQRRGRTGRTCDGQVYRLVTSSFFSQLEDYECPAILKLSLRQQVLLICCAESRAINDPKVLLQKALDPPDPKVIEDALNMLVHLNALKKTSTRGRYEPTFYGHLLSSFSLSFDASVLILKFGDIGLLREGILLGILIDAQPTPILHPFGQEHLYMEYACQYFGGNCNNAVQIGRKEMILIGNMFAFQFWQHVFKDKQRAEHLKQLLMFDEMKATTILLPNIEEEWCLFHNLVQSSLHHVSDTYEDILNSLHRFRPKFLGTSDGLPNYYDPYAFGHMCFLECQLSAEEDVVAADDEQHESSCETRRCKAVPFVPSGHFETIKVAKVLSNIIKQMRVQLTENTSDNQHNDNISGFHVTGATSQCVYFVKGSCNKGRQCLYSHSLEAKRSACKYFFTLQGCRNGESCLFSHDLGPSVPLYSSAPCLPEDDDDNAVSFLEIFPVSSDGCILLLDDANLHFSSSLACLYDPSKIISTTSMPETTIIDPLLKGVRILWGLHQPFQAILSRAKENLIPWSKVKCILWFPSLDGYSENLEIQKMLVQDFFKYLAIRILAGALYEVQVILTMNNLKFSQLQVEKMGRDSFFYLRRSFPFDEASIGQLSDVVTTRKPMVTSKPVSYVFNVQPPADVQFKDFASTLQQQLLL